MDAQELAATLAKYRARRKRLQRVDTSGMDDWEYRQHALKLAYADSVITLAEQLRERAAGMPSTSPRDQEQPMVEPQSTTGVRPLFHRDEFECWLPEVDEPLLADFEENTED
jgi:hypothetical protein